MGDSMYIVDYDIPKDPAGKRVQFYRDLKKVGDDQCNFSTMSVICTHKRELAEIMATFSKTLFQRSNSQNED
jgi:hypothetical protein